jgi:hypothetical protein
MAIYSRQFLVQYAKETEEKTRWPVVGRAFEDKKRITVKLDSLPLGEWDGRLFLYDVNRDKKE